MQEGVPTAETSLRIIRFQEFLADNAIGLALIRQPADLYYYTGTVADGFLAVPAAGKPKFLVRRPQDRLAAGEIPLDLAFYSDLGNSQPCWTTWVYHGKALWGWSWTFCLLHSISAFKTNSSRGRPSRTFLP
jgi:Xaa-Pro aminopeptidase